MRRSTESTALRSPKSLVRPWVSTTYSVVVFMWVTVRPPRPRHIGRRVGLRLSRKSEPEGPGLDSRYGSGARTAARVRAASRAAAATHRRDRPGGGRGARG